jgi:hypothetical protein
MRWHLLGIRSAVAAASIFVVFLSAVHAEVTRICLVSYVGEQSLAAPVRRSVTFATGRELNASIDKNEFSQRFDIGRVYVMLWFGPGQVAIAGQAIRPQKGLNGLLNTFWKPRFEREDFRLRFLIDPFADYQIVNGPPTPHPGAFRVYAKQYGVFVDPRERP